MSRSTPMTPEQARQLSRLAELHEGMPLAVERVLDDDPLMVEVNPGGHVHATWIYAVTPNGSVLRGDVNGWEAPTLQKRGLA